MSDIRVDIEAFIAGDLDYGALHVRLSEAFSRGESPARALAFLERLQESGGVPQGLYNVLSRAIGRYQQSAEEITDPIAGEDTVEEPPMAPLAEYPIELDEAMLPQVYTEDREAAGKAEAPPEIRLHPEAEEEAAAPAAAGDGGVTEAADDAEARAAPGAGRAAAPRVGLPRPGETLAERYLLGEITGRGGMGVVYRATDLRREEAGARETGVAVKVLRPELQGKSIAETRLMAEAMRGQALRHRNLVRVFDVGRDGGRVFVAMELLEGESLRNRIIRGGPEGMDRREARRILAGLLEAVAYLHEQGFVHGDLKPGNVFLTRDGEPKLLDFGLTRRSDRENEPLLEAVISTPGRTPAYSSPERLAGQPPDKRDDVFALGCIACELLSGKHPYRKKPADQARRDKLRPVPVRGLSPRQSRTLFRALDFNARRRPRDAGRLLTGFGFRQPRGGRASASGFLPGVLAGLAAGVLLALVLIHPGGPLGRMLGRGEPGQPQAPSAAPPREVADVDLEGAPDVPRDDSPAPASARADGAGETPEGREAPGAAARAAGGVFSPEPAAEPEPEAAVQAEAGAPPAPEAAGGASEPEVTSTAPPEPEAAASAPVGPGRIGFSAPAYSVGEDQAAGKMQLVRTGGTAGRVSVRWRTVSLSAVEGADFIGSGWQRVVFAPGQQQVRIFVPLVNDGVPETAETFFLEVAEPEGGARLAETTRVPVEIVDDD